MSAATAPGELHYRAVFLSDVHLGLRNSQAPALLDFLRYVESEELYLVGDIVDGWRLRKRWYWPARHNDIVWRIMKRAKRGARNEHRVERGNNNRSRGVFVSTRLVP